MLTNVSGSATQQHTGRCNLFAITRFGTAQRCVTLHFTLILQKELIGLVHQMFDANKFTQRDDHIVFGDQR